jgi:hypothetical protein
MEDTITHVVDKKEWKERYIKALMSYGLSEEEAHMCFDADPDMIDYELDPEMAAADEMSNW